MSSVSSQASPAGEEQRSPAHPHLLLDVGGRWYGVALPLVREVITPRPFTRLPGAPACVCGLVNLRGRVITVVDLGALLQLSSSAGPGHRVVVLEHQGRTVGLTVDDAPRIARCDTAEDADGEAEDAFDELDLDALLPQLFG